MGLSSMLLLSIGSTTLEAKMKLGKTIAASAAATTVATATTKLLNKSGKDYTELTLKFSDSDLLDLLKSEGYSGASIKREGLVKIKIDGRSYLLYNAKRGDLQLYYGITGVGISYKDVNKWNYDKKYSKAYVDDDMDVALESDLEAEAGLTKQQVLEFLDTFIGSVRVFRNFVIDHDKS